MRQCLSCSSTMTSINNNGFEKWYSCEGEEYICHNCYGKSYYRDNIDKLRPYMREYERKRREKERNERKREK